MDKTIERREERGRDRERESKVLVANSKSSASGQLPGKHNLRQIAITDEYKRSRNVQANLLRATFPSHFIRTPLTLDSFFQIVYN